MKHCIEIFSGILHWFLIIFTKYGKIFQTLYYLNETYFFSALSNTHLFLYNFLSEELTSNILLGTSRENQRIFVVVVSHERECLILVKFKQRKQCLCSYRCHSFISISQQLNCFASKSDLKFASKRVYKLI